jgi:hypothetical protein
MFDEINEAGNDQRTVGKAIDPWQTFEEPARQ